VWVYTKQPPAYPVLSGRGPRSPENETSSSPWTAGAKHTVVPYNLCNLPCKTTGAQLPFVPSNHHNSKETAAAATSNNSKSSYKCCTHTVGGRGQLQLYRRFDLISYILEHLRQRCTSRAQRTVCDYEFCCAVHECTRWNGPACSWWGEGRIGNWRGSRTDSKRERQMICLLRYDGGCRFNTASSHTCTVHCTRAGILCTFDLRSYIFWNINQCSPLKIWFIYYLINNLCDIINQSYFC
jgi:hypothetical protein